MLLRLLYGDPPHACSEISRLEHRLDPATDNDETLRALSDLVCEGKVRAIGASSWASLTAISGPPQMPELQGYHRCIPFAFTRVP